MPKIRLSELLDFFTVTDLSDALFQLNLPQVGTKAERIERLCSQAGKAPREILDAFKAEAIRLVCDELNITPGRKSDMIAGLFSLLEESSHAEPTTAALVSDQRDQAIPRPLPATKENVISSLNSLRIPKRKARDEADARDEIRRHLTQVFEAVIPEYNIGGYLRLAIDLDIGDGKVGVEVKLGDSLFDSAQEIQRMIGQAIYYQKRKYRANLLVAVVGDRELLEDPLLRETYSLLEDSGITCVRVPTY